MHDDTADLPGLGVRRRSSKRGDDNRTPDTGGVGREAARGTPELTPEFQTDRIGGGRSHDEGGRPPVVEPSATNGRREPVGAVGDGPPERAEDGRPGMFEVPRRSSKRSSEDFDGAADRDRTVLRMEQQQQPSGEGTHEPAVSGESPAPSNDAERNAQAAKERLARFQRAVRQGRAQTGGPLSAAERNGGDPRDA
jgi:hypothetical protein